MSIDNAGNKLHSHYLKRFSYCFFVSVRCGTSVKDGTSLACTLVVFSFNSTEADILIIYVCVVES